MCVCVNADRKGLYWKFFFPQRSYHDIIFERAENICPILLKKVLIFEFIQKLRADQVPALRSGDLQQRFRHSPHRVAAAV